jgi:hypothetical protein
MKLQELAAISPTKQAAKVFESYFGGRVTLDTISRAQARTLLNRVRTLVKEHRRTPEFHYSEQNPSYLKLIMMEQVLATKVSEDAMGGATIGIGQSSTTPTNSSNPQQQQALMAAQQQQKKRQIQDQIKIKQKEIQDLQQQMNSPVTTAMAETRRSLRQRLKESEIQQAQVVLASQDMVDQVQKMSEQVSAMQFKDLPALVDQIRNEVGADQATQFNGDASAALSGLLQNLQASKQQLEAALGVVTGQAPQVPGQDMGAEVASDINAADADLAGAADLDAAAAGDDLDAEMDANLGAPKASLGRGRR